MKQFRGGHQKSIRRRSIGDAIVVELLPPGYPCNPTNPRLKQYLVLRRDRNSSARIRMTRD